VISRAATMRSPTIPASWSTPGGRLFYNAVLLKALRRASDTQQVIRRIAIISTRLVDDRSQFDRERLHHRRRHLFPAHEAVGLFAVIRQVQRKLLRRLTTPATTPAAQLEVVSPRLIVGSSTALSTAR
jgi:hypothetical protein